MKKIKIIMTLCIVIFIMILSAKYIQSQQNKTRILTDYVMHNNVPSNALLQLLSLEQIKHDTSLSTIVQETQKQWVQKIRPHNEGVIKERWEIENDVINYLEQKRAEYLPVLQQLGLIDEIKPFQKSYKYAFILGGLTASVRKRLKYFVDIWKQGVRVECIVLLGSARPLDEKMDEIATLYDDNTSEKVPHTESEMMQYIYEHENLPESLKQLPLKIVNTPMIQINGLSQRRPTTGDTIKTWLEDNPAAGSVLAISHQPYCGYPYEVIRTYLPSNFAVEVCGIAADSNQKIAVYLDTLGRWLYQLLEQEKNR